MYIDVIIIQNTNITTARAELFKLASSCIKYNNVIMLSEEDYNLLIESLYLAGIPGMYESIVEGANTPVEECVKVEWK